MNESINLVSNKNEAADREQRILKILRLLAVSMLTTIALVSIGTFVISTQIPLSSIRQQENSTMAGLSGLHKKLATYYLAKDRISNIQTLLVKRQDFIKVINPIFSKLPTELSIQTLNIEQNSITITTNGTSLSFINQFINDMEGLGNKDKIFKNLKLQTLSLNSQNGTYSITLIADLL